MAWGVRRGGGVHEIKALHGFLFPVISRWILNHHGSNFALYITLDISSFPYRGEILSPWLRPAQLCCSRFLPHHFRRAGEPERFSHGEGTAFPSPSPSISSADGHGNRAVPPKRGAGSLLIAPMGQHPGRGAARCHLRREGKAKSQRGRGQQTGEAPRGGSGGAQRSGCTPPQAAKRYLHQSRSLLPSAPLYL